MSDQGILATVAPRDCPVCGQGSGRAAPFLSSTIDPARMTAFSFASRKAPEYMSFRLVRCRDCATVFAAEAPSAEALAGAYRSAGYDSAEEAVHAARTYAAHLAPRLEPGLPESGTALEIGTGTGVFLRELRAMGFRTVVGIEPSAAAIDAAEPDVRDLILPGVFQPDRHAHDSLALVCCFQTLEHVPDPLELTRSVFDLLRPGGQIALVTHDYTATINRLLGRRSPVIDVEHMQLFCPESLKRLLSSGGFEDVVATPIRNSYPLRYWLRLLPLPDRIKGRLIRTVDAVGLGAATITMGVGNLMTTARKPASDAAVAS